MRIIFASFLILASIVSHDAIAADGGRYQAIVLPKNPGDTFSTMMILDTTTGDLWQWMEAPGMGKISEYLGMTYMGKVTPGSAPGETRPFQRFNPQKQN